MVTQGIRMLTDKRGAEGIKFKDVADHLADYVDRFPSEKESVDKVARFLAGVEDVDHEHESGGKIGSDA